ncbi:MAG: PIN domain-containing protein [Prevotella sp.]|nr:PIN domain-containing protein [Prevotella sp.]MBQ6210743.1 PIN domain-containing protein [Prevotella sp.]
MKVFLDTNVLLDHLAKREGFYADAAIIFSMVNDGLLLGLISSLSIINCAYVLPKHYDRHDVMEQIKIMLKMFTVCNVDASVLEKAVNINPYDFEDAVQYLSSLPHKPDVIITRDKRGFRDFDIPVMTPKEFVTKAKE